eukprot:3859670-Pyramimonas_sp.AAC.1
MNLIRADPGTEDGSRLKKPAEGRTVAPAPLVGIREASRIWHAAGEGGEVHRRPRWGTAASTAVGR